MARLTFRISCKSLFLLSTLIVGSLVAPNGFSGETGEPTGIDYFQNVLPPELQQKVIGYCIPGDGERTLRNVGQTSQALLAIVKSTAIQKELDSYYEWMLHKLNQNEISEKDAQELLTIQPELVKRTWRQLNQEALESLKKYLVTLSQEETPEGVKRFDPSSRDDQKKAYVAAFVAHYGANLHVANDAVWDYAGDAAQTSPRELVGVLTVADFEKAARQAARNAALTAAAESAWAAAENVLWKTLYKVIWNAPGMTVWDATQKVATSSVWDVVEESLKARLPKTLSVLKLSNSSEIGESASKLAEILALNELKDHQTEVFIKSFNAAYDALNDLEYARKAERIIDQSTQETSLPQNDFLKEFNNYLDDVRNHLSNPHG